MTAKEFEYPVEILKEPGRTVRNEILTSPDLYISLSSGGQELLTKKFELPFFTETLILSILTSTNKKTDRISRIVGSLAQELIYSVSLGKKLLNKKVIIDILKEVIMAGDFNMNLLDFEQNKKVQNFLNIMFGHSMMPVINKPTHVNKNTATAVDHIFINSVTTTKFKTEILTLDISDRFPIFFVAEFNIHIKETKERFIFRCDLSDISAEKFKYNLRTVSWDSITNSSDKNKAYDNFIEIFSSFYDECFPKKN